MGRERNGKGKKGSEREREGKKRGGRGRLEYLSRGPRVLSYATDECKIQSPMPPPKKKNIKYKKTQPIISKICEADDVGYTLIQNFITIRKRVFAPRLRLRK